MNALTAVEYKGNIYIVTNSPTGCLFKTDPETQVTSFVKQLYVENKVGMSYYKTIRYGREAWFLPWDSKRIVVIDLETFEETYYIVTGLDFYKGHGFIDYVMCGEDTAVLIPSGDNFNTIAVVNLTTKDITYYTDAFPMMRCIGAYYDNDIVHLVSDEGIILSELELKTRKIIYRYSANEQKKADKTKEKMMNAKKGYPGNEIRYQEIYSNKEGTYSINLDGYIYEYDLKGNVTQKISYITEVPADLETPKMDMRVIYEHSKGQILNESDELGLEDFIGLCIEDKR